MSLALRLVRTSAAARRGAPGSRFRYVLVDEFQDTNRAQSELVSILAEPHRNVTVVGDDDQSIYKFRGAAISNILEFRDRYRVGPDRRPAAELPLARADPRRAVPARPLQRSGPARGPGRRSRSGSGRSARTADERAGPARGIRDGRRGGGLDRRARSAGGSRPGRAPRDHAVLVRANGHADPILRSLNAAGIPWRFSGTSGLYARPEVRLPARVPAGGRGPLARASTSTRVADRPSCTPRRRGPDRDREHGPPPQSHRLGGRSRSSSGSRASCGSRRRPGPRSRRLVGDLRALHDARPRAAGGRGALRVPARTRAGSPGSRRRDSSAAEEAALRTSRGSSTSSGPSRRSSPTTGPSSSRATSRPSSRPATIRRPRISIPTPTRSRVLTVHKAKGLEFPVVFLPGLVAGRFPARAGASRSRCRSSSSTRSLPRGRRPAPGGASAVLRRR